MKTEQPGTTDDRLATRVPRAAPDERAGAVREALLGRKFDCSSHVAVCDGGRLAGLLPIEALLAAPRDAPLSSLMDRDPPVVNPDRDEEAAAWQPVRKDETALCVTDADGRFLGLVPPRRLVAMLLAEHEEDLSRLSGFTGSELLIRTTSEEPVRRRVRHRLPWLMSAWWARRRRRTWWGGSRTNSGPRSSSPSSFRASSTWPTQWEPRPGPSPYGGSPSASRCDGWSSASCWPAQPSGASSP